MPSRTQTRTASARDKSARIKLGNRIKKMESEIARMQQFTIDPRPIVAARHQLSMLNDEYDELARKIEGRE